jgi:hypothetical protein
MTFERFGDLVLLQHSLHKVEDPVDEARSVLRDILFFNSAAIVPMSQDWGRFSSHGSILPIHA